MLEEVTKIEPGIGIEPSAVRRSITFAFDFQTCFCQLHRVFEALIEFLFTPRLISNSRQVHGDHTYGTGEGIRSEEPPALLLQLALVKTQAQHMLRTSSGLMEELTKLEK